MSIGVIYKLIVCMYIHENNITFTHKPLQRIIAVDITEHLVRRDGQSSSLGPFPLKQEHADWQMARTTHEQHEYKLINHGHCNNHYSKYCYALHIHQSSRRQIFDRKLRKGELISAAGGEKKQPNHCYFNPYHNTIDLEFVGLSFFRRPSSN